MLRPETRIKWTLLLVFIGFPLLEIYLLIKVGGLIGATTTVAFIIFTGVLGALLLRHQGTYTLRQVQRNMQQGQVPALILMEGMLIFVAGLLLITPGFLTDLMGFSLLVPPLRQWVVRHIVMKLFAFPPRDFGGGPPGGGPSGPRTIEGEYTREKD